MIVKKKDSPKPKDRFEKAGNKAEEQMAFYLRRAFAEVPDVFIFNDLRLLRKAEVAQIDHLVLHRFGLVIVESKSITGTVEVNKYGEFTRVFGTKRSGMQSPIQQAKLQKELLQKLLNDHKEVLRRKVIFGTTQGRFIDDRFRILVAVSDKGIIERNGIDPPELYKADTITNAIQKIIDDHKCAEGVSGFVRGMASKKVEQDYLLALQDDEQQMIVRFLLDQNMPAQRPSNVATEEIVEAELVEDDDGIVFLEAVVPDSADQVLPSPKCRHCKSKSLMILYGHNYYFKCQYCDGNTPLDHTCTACGSNARISKRGLDFTRICKSCGHNEFVHQNPE